MKLFSFLCALCLLFGCSETETDSQTANTGSNDIPDSEQIDDTSGEPECTEAPAEIWVSAEDSPLEYRELADGSVLSQVGVRGLRGCETLDHPLAAFNWWTVEDEDTREEYDNHVAPLLIDMGAKVIYAGKVNSTTQVPEGTVSDGTPWLQETLQFPLYPSPESFAGMIASEAWLSVGGYKMNETNADDYDFVFMKCFYGCEEIQAISGFLAFDHKPVMAHLFNGSQKSLSDAVEPIAAALSEAGLGKLYFAGYAWALPIMKFVDMELPPTDTLNNGFWVDGLVLVSMEPDTVPEDILGLQAYKDFVNNTQNDTVVTLGMNF